ncbi:MAG TPA: hypothetical protein VGB55_06225 [Tepidisphaeraceae bacterium]|jgi:hypothetical protein
MITHLSIQTNVAIDLAENVAALPAGTPTMLKATLTDAAGQVASPQLRAGTMVVHLDGKRLPDTTRFPYELPLPTMTIGRRKLVIEQFLSGKAVDRRLIWLSVSETSSAPPPVDPRPATFTRGLCIYREDVDSDAKADALTARLRPMGITSLRWFGSSVSGSGALAPSALRAAKRMIDRGFTVTELYGPPERKAGKTPAYPESDDAVQRFFATLAVLRPASPLHRVSLLNEINLPHYWRWGRGDQLSAEAVSQAMKWVRLARQELGRSVYLIGPSVGWDAAPQPHFAYQRGMIDAGLLEQVDAVDAHLYPTSIDYVDAILGGLREIAPAAPLHLTEINWRGKIDCCSNIAAMTNRLDHHKIAEACIYRLRPVPHASHLAHVSLVDELDILRADVAAAWGLKVSP